MLTKYETCPRRSSKLIAISVKWGSIDGEGLFTNIRTYMCKKKNTA